MFVFESHGALVGLLPKMSLNLWSSVSAARVTHLVYAVLGTGTHSFVHAKQAFYPPIYTPSLLEQSLYFIIVKMSGIVFLLRQAHQQSLPAAPMQMLETRVTKWETWESSGQ